MTADVNAGPEVVWALFVNVERWPELTASMRKVRRLDQGQLNVGSVAMVDQPHLPTARWRVTQLEPGRSFFWETTAPGVTTIGGHVVEANGEGSIVTLALKQTGPLAGLLGAMLGSRIRQDLSMELDGFRRGAEARVAQDQQR